MSTDGPRALDKQEVDHLIEFLDQNLRPNQNWSVRDEFPTTFSPQNHHNMRVIKKDGEVLSHAAIRNLIIRSSQAVFQVAAIGSVVTSSEHRKMGLSTEILKDCIKIGRDQGADLAVLWSDMFNFYQRLGFELEAILKMDQVKPRTSEPRDTQVFARYNQHGLPDVEASWERSPS